MSSAFTAREMTLLACAFRAMDNVPKINYAKMAELAGMSNQNSAANAWRQSLCVSAGRRAGYPSKPSDMFTKPHPLGPSEEIPAM